MNTQKKDMEIQSNNSNNIGREERTWHFKGGCSVSYNIVIIMQAKKTYSWITFVTLCKRYNYMWPQRYALKFYMSENIFKFSKHKTEYP